MTDKEEFIKEYNEWLAEVRDVTEAIHQLNKELDKLIEALDNF